MGMLRRVGKERRPLSPFGLPSEGLLSVGISGSRSPGTRELRTYYQLDHATGGYHSFEERDIPKCD